MSTINVEPFNADDFLGWTEESTKQYILDKPLQKGDLMLIVNTQAGFLDYVLAEVTEPSLGKQRRVNLSHGAAFGGNTFFRSGKNCWSPKGQSRMIPPDDRVLAHISAVGDTLHIKSYCGH